MQSSQKTRNKASEKLLQRYLNDEAVMRIATSAASPFSTQLSKDEIYNCILNALWRAVSKYDKRNQTKFTTYLFKGVVFECLNQRRFKLSQKSGDPYVEVPVDFKDFESVDMIELINVKCEDPDLIIDKFYKNMTFNEIAANHNVCGETIRVRIEKNLDKLKKALMF